MGLSMGWHRSRRSRFGRKVLLGGAMTLVVGAGSAVALAANAAENEVYDQKQLLEACQQDTDIYGKADRCRFEATTYEPFVAPDKPVGHGIEFVSGWVENLPFPDKSFDTVICTHVIEHILDYRDAIAELRRIARRRLIIVVPREREGIYTFNPHFNFFPYTHSFLRAMIPVPKRHVCVTLGRDIYYREDVANDS